MQNAITVASPSPAIIPVAGSKFDGNTRVDAPFKVAAGSRGQMRGELSAQWRSRPADQRFTNLADLEAFVSGTADSSFTEVVNTSDLRVSASMDDAENLGLVLPGDKTLTPTNWSFDQMCKLLGAPAAYLRKLPATITGINLQYALKTFRSEVVKVYARKDNAELRAVTGPDYGRIFDREIVRAVRGIAGNGTGDARWKVPGMLDWSTGCYNPFVDITNENTTLYASDRDIWLFLVDDTHPIEIGKLPNGDPDLVFRGFYVYNSEVGAKKAGIAAFYFRGVCCNRLMWGVERFEEISVRHSKFGPSRFEREARPALESFANGRTDLLLDGVRRAKAAVVAKDDESATEFLTERVGVTQSVARKVIAAVLDEEQREPRSVWDFVNGITAVARGTEYADERVGLERVAGKLLDKVAA